MMIEQLFYFLIQGNVNKQVLSELSAYYSEISDPFTRTVKSNVAIAAAITAHARIYMNQFKQNNFIIYTDTDSIITTQPLPDKLLGNELGMFKDELNGCLIQEIYVLGIKQYAYWYNDNNGHRIEKSVWAGVERDSLSFH